MSHFTRVRTKIVDEAILRAALKNMGYSVESARSGVKGWNGNRTAADLKISPGPGEYEIGFVQDGGSYSLVADWWGIRSLDEGDFVSDLTQQYGLAGAVETLAKQGYEMGERVQDEDGTIRVKLRRAV